jgi:ABC-type uncharacterized transport system permease subunit
MKRLNQSGSHIIGIALFVLALGVVGFAGYKVTQAHHQSADSSSTTTSKTTPSVPASIKTSADLNQAGTVLDGSSAQLNSGLDDSSLNTDLDSML